MGYVFTLILSREISDEEKATLREAIGDFVLFGSDTLPTNAEVTVTKVDVDDTVTQTLAESIEAALEAVKQVPDLGIPGLTVPAQPATREAEQTVVGEAVEIDAEPVAAEAAAVS